MKRWTLCLILLSLVSTQAVRAQTPDTPTPRSLTMDEAVSIATRNNPQVALAESDVQSSRARLTGAFGQFLPRLDVGAGYNKQLFADDEVIFNGIVIPGSRPDYSYNASASASLLLFDGFSRSANYNSVQADYNAALAGVRRTQNDLSYQVRSSYLATLRADQIVELRQIDRELTADKLTRARGRAELGAGIPLQVYQLEADLANADFEIERARSDALVSASNLAVILNIDPATPLQLSTEGLLASVDSSEVRAARLALGTREEMLMRQRDRRLDLVAARYRVESAREAARAASSTYWPSVSAGLGWYWQKSGPLEGSSNTQFTLDFRYTPFDGFQTSEQVQLAEARRLSAELDLRRLEIQAENQLVQAQVKLDNAERQMVVAERAVSTARRSRDAADERYQLGAGQYADYVLANSQYLTARINQIDALYNWRLALVELRNALGE